jgi:hypothetical protein
MMMGAKKMETSPLLQQHLRELAEKDFGAGLLVSIRACSRASATLSKSTSSTWKRCSTSRRRYNHDKAKTLEECCRQAV